MMRKLKKIFKTSEIIGIDRYTVEHEPIKSLDLMERASEIFTLNLLKKYPDVVDYTVVAGWGNNGGDGLAIARMLQERGKQVTVFSVISSSVRTPDCEANVRRWKGPLFEVREAHEFNPADGTLVIDALFGSGLSRKVEGELGKLIQKINACSGPVVAVDIPSGLMGENNAGNDPRTIVRATCTFTFQFPKLAFMFAENAPYVGEWEVLDIGLHPAIIDRLSTDYYYLTEEFIAGLLPVSEKFAHKGMHGHGLLIAGSYGMMGAAVLSAKAAVRSGIGLLTCHIPQRGNDVIQLSVPEALVERDENEVLFSGPRILTAYRAVGIGPGLGTKRETVEGVKRVLQEWRGMTVLDADALNILASHPEMLDLLHAGCILTPHPKEFERLAGKSENDFERLNKLSIFASRYNVCVVLKGAHTVIASPSRGLCFNMTGNPGMAKAGAGDVLTGVILALAANGMDPWEAAVAGVFAHGLAGDLLAEEKSMRGICAGNLAEMMEKVWKTLENKSKIYKE